MEEDKEADNQGRLGGGVMRRPISPGKNMNIEPDYEAANRSTPSRSPN